LGCFICFSLLSATQFANSLRRRAIYKSPSKSQPKKKLNRTAWGICTKKNFQLFSSKLYTSLCLFRTSDAMQ
jgi:hypothetical protein